MSKIEGKRPQFFERIFAVSLNSERFGGRGQILSTAGARFNVFECAGLQ
jgi:hypothetical protein